MWLGFIDDIPDTEIPILTPMVVMMGMILFSTLCYYDIQAMRSQEP